MLRKAAVAVLLLASFGASANGFMTQDTCAAEIQTVRQTDQAQLQTVQQACQLGELRTQDSQKSADNASLLIWASLAGGLGLLIGVAIGRANPPRTQPLV